MVVLNSNCGQVGGCESDSPQGRWLRNDLQNNRSRCTLAYFHHPLRATGTNTPSPQVRPFWSMLHDRGADVILSGHAHRYERHAPMTPGGERSARGIRQFVVGSGGADGGSEIHEPQTPNLQVVEVGTPGVLRLGLRADSCAWKFVPIAGGSFTDSGTDRCHQAVFHGSVAEARRGRDPRAGLRGILYLPARRSEGGDSMEDRISYFERMLADNPENPTGLLALANEYKKAGRDEDEAAVLKRYVGAHEDEGNAYLRLGEVLTKLGREDEAREAYGAGIGQAEKFGHSGMAEDLRLAQVQLRA